MAAKQIDKEFGKRFDKKAAEVRAIAARARSLEKQGREGEALKSV